MNLRSSSLCAASLADEFARVAIRISNHYARCGAKVAPFASYAVPHFRALPASKQVSVLGHLYAFGACLESSEAAGDSLHDSPRALWHAFRVHGLVPGAQLLNHVDPSAVMEIYDASGFQVWRSLNFMQFCSYTLEEIYCVEWFLRYDRDPHIGALCLSNARLVLEGRTGPIFHPGIGEHQIRERSSKELLELAVDHHTVAPLRGRTMHIDCYFVASSVRLLSVEAQEEMPPPAADFGQHPGLRLV